MQFKWFAEILPLLIVFLGGGLGSCCRFLVGQVIAYKIATPFPLGTFSVNIAGSFIIGIVIGLAQRYQLNYYWILLLTTGFCGGFTTFSAFSLENNLLIKSSNYFLSMTYVLMSLLWGFAATFIALWLVKRL